MFPVAGLLSIADVPGITSGVVGVSTVPFEHAVASGPAVTGFPAVEGVAVAFVPADLLCCDPIGLWLSNCIFFSSNYRNIKYRIGKFKKLLDIGSRPQSIGLSDIGLRKNYRLPQCPPL